MDVGEQREAFTYLVMYWKSMRYAREAVMTLRSPQIASVREMGKQQGEIFAREGSCFKFELTRRGSQTCHVDEDAG